jgi:acetyl-CoA acetyltransferase family protein
MKHRFIIDNSVRVPDSSHMLSPLVIDAIRTPLGRGKAGGALSEVHPTDLLSTALAAIVARSGIDPGVVDDVIVGCVSQVGEQAGAVGRIAWLSAGFPEHVPATTVDRRCGSSQQAIHFAAQGIASGAYDIVIAAGIESMSRVPMFTARLDKDPYGPRFHARYKEGLIPQGIAAELVAARWKITREDMDAFSVQSHLRAARARDLGYFGNEIVPVDVAGTRLDCDETIRPSTSLDRLSKLEPSFIDEGAKRRFPDIRWSVTAGNSSQLADGAAATLLMSESAAARHGLKPRARFVAFDVVGDDPIQMLTAPMPSTRRALCKAGLSIGQIDVFEVNEAFSSVPLAWLEEFHVDPERVNPSGGAVALGHPLGASGGRIMATLLNGLERVRGRYGLQTMCEAGGLANTTIIERLS